MVIVVFGNGLIYWSGVLTGLFFVLSFFGCVCNFKYFKSTKIMSWLRVKHVIFMRVAFVLFLVHGGLAILSSRFGIYI